MKKKAPKKLIVSIDATHAGIVNGNRFMYLPDGMKKGEKSFTEPYRKPITDGHPGWFSSEKDTPVLGRVIDAEYISYGLNDEMDNLNTRAENIADVVQKAYRQQLDTQGFKGLGHMKIKAEVTDRKAIEEIMDGRKVTVSIGAYLDNARCSVCGSRAGDCEHEIGSSYDGMTAFRVGGNMKFDHVGFVKTPADEHAMVTNIEIADNVSDSFNIMVCDEVQITEYSEVKVLKERFVEAFDSLMNKAETRKIRKEFLDAYHDSAVRGRQHSFLFTDSKEVYLKDKLGLLVAKLVIDSLQIDESEKEEADTIREVIDTLIETGRFVQLKDEETTIQKLFDEMQEDVVVQIEDNKAEKEEEKPHFIQLDKETIDSIADAVYNKIKQEETKTDSFSKERVKRLELALIELEDKLDNAETDLVSFAKKFNKEVNDAISARDYFMKMESSTEETPELEKLNLNDSIITTDDLTKDEVVSDNLEQVEEIDYTAIRDNYKTLLREKGFKDAKEYLKKLREDGKIPENFIL